MQIAILLFDRFAAIDAVTLHGALSALPGADAAFVATAPGPVRDDTRRLELTADAALHEVPRPTVLALPGGDGASLVAHNGAIEAWIGSAVRHGAWVVTVASGSLLAGRAEVLPGRLVSARSASNVAPLIKTMARQLEQPKGIR